jgi:hypothetical protein
MTGLNILLFVIFSLVMELLWNSVDKFSMEQKMLKHQGRHLSTNAEKEIRYIQYGSLLLF